MAHNVLLVSMLMVPCWPACGPYTQHASVIQQDMPYPLLLYIYVYIYIYIMAHNVLSVSMLMVPCWPACGPYTQHASVIQQDMPYPLLLYLPLSHGNYIAIVTQHGAHNQASCKHKAGRERVECEHLRVYPCIRGTAVMILIGLPTVG